MAGDIGDDGRYVNWKMIGKGGTANVFKVHDEKIGTDVAVKLLNDKAMKLDSLRNAVALEVRISRELHHSCICPIYDLYDGPNGFGTVMKLISGMEMRDWMDERKNDLLGTTPQRLTIFRKLTEALSVAHSFIVHRDLKPQNVFLENDDPARPVIMDFGISVVQDSGDGGPGGFTPKYMSPEQWQSFEQNKDIIDHRSDLFTLGIIAYELFTNRIPPTSFKSVGKTRRPPKVNLAEVDPPSHFNAGVHPALDQIIMQLMAFDREDRPQSADGILSAFRNIPREAPDAAQGEIERPRVAFDGGDFFLGSGPSGRIRNEKPGRKITLGPFEMDVFPVTNADYKEFLERTGYAAPPFIDHPEFGAPKKPVVGVTWADAKAFAEWAGGDLPTEAQWECMAKGGKAHTQFPWGDDEASPTHANIGEIQQGTTAVGSFPQGKSGYGVEDMCGNVWEWCRDVWNEGYYGGLSHGEKDPVSESGSNMRSIRGGSFNSFVTMGRCTCRGQEAPDERRPDLGFRLVYEKS